MNEIKVVTITMKEEELKKLIQEAVSQKSEKEEMPPAQEELLTREATAKLLSVNLSTLWHWTKKGKIKAYGIGNRVYYKRGEIDSALIPINKPLKAA